MVFLLFVFLILLVAYSIAGVTANRFGLVTKREALIWPRYFYLDTFVGSRPEK